MKESLDSAKIFPHMFRFVINRWGWKDTIERENNQKLILEEEIKKHTDLEIDRIKKMKDDKIRDVHNNTAKELDLLQKKLKNIEDKLEGKIS